MQAAAELSHVSNVVPLTGMNLGVEELGDQLDLGFWDTFAGVAAGVVVGAGAIAGGIAIGMALAT